MTLVRSLFLNKFNKSNNLNKSGIAIEMLAHVSRIWYHNIVCTAGDFDSVALSLYAVSHF